MQQCRWEVTNFRCYTEPEKNRGYLLGLTYPKIIVYQLTYKVYG